MDGIKTTASTVWNGIKSFFSSVLEGIKTIFSTVWTAIKTTVTTVVNGIKTHISIVWNTIKRDFYGNGSNFHNYQHGLEYDQG